MRHVNREGRMIRKYALIAAVFAAGVFVGVGVQSATAQQTQTLRAVTANVNANFGNAALVFQRADGTVVHCNYDSPEATPRCRRYTPPTR